MIAQGLAGPSSGEHHDGSLKGERSLSLLGIQPGKDLIRIRHDRESVTRRVLGPAAGGPVWTACLRLARGRGDRHGVTLAA